MEKREFIESESVRLTGFSRPDLCYFGYWNLTSLAQGSEQTKIFSALESWARSLGHKQIYGPIDGSTLGTYRLRINCFSEAPFWGEPANLEEPVKYLKSVGFVIAEKYFSYIVHDLVKLRPFVLNLAKKIPKAAISDLSYEPLRLDDWPHMEVELCSVANQIFAKNFAFTPMEIENFRTIYTPEVRAMICERTSLIVRSKENKIIGFCVNFKDPQNSQRLLVKTLGVVESHRRMGFPFFEMIRRIFEAENLYQSAVLCLMRDGNVPALIMKDFADELREYALFRKDLF